MFFFQVKISHVLLFISFCDPFTDSLVPKPESSSLLIITVCNLFWPLQNMGYVFHITRYNDPREVPQICTFFPPYQKVSFSIAPSLLPCLIKMHVQLFPRPRVGVLNISDAGGSGRGGKRTLVERRRLSMWTISLPVTIDLPSSALDAETFQLLSYCTVIHQLPLVFFLSRDANFMLERQACLGPLSPALKGGVAIKPQDSFSLYLKEIANVIFVFLVFPDYCLSLCLVSNPWAPALLIIILLYLPEYGFIVHKVLYQRGMFTGR